MALPPLVDVMFMQQKFKYGRSGHNLKTVLTIHMAYSSKTHDIIRDIIIFFFWMKKESCGNSQCCTYFNFGEETPDSVANISP